VVIDPASGRVQRIVALQYTPDALTRTLEPRGTGGDEGDRLEALRLTGPPVETLRIEAEIDAADQLELAGPSSTVTLNGIHPQLAALETLVYPRSAEIAAAQQLGTLGALEALPLEAPLTLFVWSEQRIVPVRVVDFSVTEEAFDPSLRPIRARVTLSMRVLTSNDLPPGHRGISVFAVHHRQKERLATLDRAVSLKGLGIEAIP
jgi:hypothetical protein